MSDDPLPLCGEVAVVTGGPLGIRVVASMPMRRLAPPEEVAEAVPFLAGPVSSMITGHTLPVDGGYLAV